MPGAFFKSPSLVLVFTVGSVIVIGMQDTVLKRSWKKSVSFYINDY